MSELEERLAVKPGASALSKRVRRLSDGDVRGLFFNIIGYYTAQTNDDWYLFQTALETFLPDYEKVSNVQNK